MAGSDTESEFVAAFQQGQRRALEALASGTAVWLSSSSDESGVHPELCVPNVRIFVTGHLTEAAFIQGHNQVLLAAHGAGKLRDFRSRALGLEEIEVRFATGGVARLLPGGKLASLDGRYATSWSAPSLA